MIISKEVESLRNSILELKGINKSAVVGFVPTMGALHEGHLSLVNTAAETCDIVVVSIFVNPTQFNDSKDLERYPRTEERDVEKLKQTKCAIVFIPSVDVVYPKKTEPYEIDLAGLDKVMEGKFREGHFNGVAMVVERLLEIVQPEKAFFGLKDFQQVAIINQMVKTRGISTEIVPVEIVRSKDGLALSSRNELLSPKERQEALEIYHTLNFGKALVDKGKTPEQVLLAMHEFFEKGNLRLEYIELVDEHNLMPAQEFKNKVYCCIAAYCGSVRLIDNMKFYP